MFLIKEIGRKRERENVRNRKWRGRGIVASRTDEGVGTMRGQVTSPARAFD